MTDITGIRKKLEKKLKSERYEHTLGVMYTASSLAMCHGGDIQKAVLAGLLHDCGKYVNMMNSTLYSYDIVMATEFIGLSEQEKRMIADVIKYNSWPEVPELQTLTAALDRKNYIRMLKLTAILRIANGMDRSHKQKIKKISVSLKEKELLIRADTIYDITLEQSIMDSKGHFFEEIYGFRPVLRQKRR